MSFNFWTHQFLYTPRVVEAQHLILDDVDAVLDDHIIWVKEKSYPILEYSLKNFTIFNQASFAKKIHALVSQSLNNDIL